MLITLLLGLLFLGFNSTNVVAVKQPIIDRNYNGKTVEFDQEDLHYKILGYKVLSNPLPPSSDGDYNGLERYLVCTVKITNESSGKEASAEEVSAYDFMGWSGPNTLYAVRKPAHYENPEGTVTLETDSDSHNNSDALKVSPGSSKTLSFFYIVYPDDNLNITVTGLSGTIENISLKRTNSNNGIVAD